jgi:hypothetical protein
MTDIAQSPEAVAYNLFLKVLAAENNPKADREYYLSAYVQCLQAAKGNYETAEQKEAFRRALVSPLTILALNSEGLLY